VVDGYQGIACRPRNVADLAAALFKARRWRAAQAKNGPAGPAVRPEAFLGESTVAGIWLTAGLGMGIGAGLYLLTAAAALLGLFGLALSRLLERLFPHSENQ